MRRSAVLVIAAAAFGAGLWTGRAVRQPPPPAPATPPPGRSPGLSLRTSLPADEPLPGIRPLRGDVEARKVELAAQFRNAFLVPVESAFEMDLPAEAPLELHTGIGVLADDPLSVRGELRFEIVDRTPGHPATVLYTRRVLATETARDGWYDCRVTLEPAATATTRVSFEVDLASQDRDLPASGLAGIRAAWALPRVRRAGESHRPNLILVSLDTLRADHLGALGYWRPTTPNLDRLARGGILFEQAVTQATWTLPSHMSLFTSLLPDTHGVTGPTPDESRSVSLRVSLLAGDRPMLAELQQRAGYATAAFTGGVALDPSLGFARGFDLYETRLGPLTGYGAARVGDWLDDRGRAPFFLFLHSYQIHAPYSGTAFAPAPPGGAREVNLAAYDGAIRQADRYLGMLLGRLRELRVYDDTIVVVFGDHGEEFGDHDPAYIDDAHGHSLYDELLRVPLVISYGDKPPFPPGRRVHQQVGLIDVMPTLLELLALPVPDGLQGQSLVPLIRGKRGFAARAAVGACTLEDSQKWSLRTLQTKYIVTTRSVPRNGDLSAALDAPLLEELFELARDPGEKRNLCPGQPDRCAGLRRELAGVIASAREARSPASTSEGVRHDVEERLRALGYVK